MPEWKAEISAHLANLRLTPTREAAIVEELAQHLDDCYAELLNGGATEAEAYRAALADIACYSSSSPTTLGVQRQTTDILTELQNHPRAAPSVTGAERSVARRETS
jgi:hypothetical protein